MEMNRMEYERMMNTKRIITDMFANGNLRKYKIASSLWAKVIVKCYKEIVKSMRHSTKTNFADVKKFFVNRGFFVVPATDDGWEIYISRRLYREAKLMESRVA